MTTQTSPTRRGVTGQSIIGVIMIASSLVAVAIYEMAHLAGFSFGQSLYSIDDYDEGVYTATASLIAQGHQLYGQIYSAQPPLFPASMAVTFRLFGAGVSEARITVLLFGLITILAVAWVAFQALGWLAAGLAAALLSVSPEFLVYSHAIEEEVPMLALATVALALGMRWRSSRQLFPAILSGLFFGFAILTKFFALLLLAPFAVIFVISILDRRRDSSIRASGSSEATGAFGFVVAAVAMTLLSLLLFGRDEITQMVNDRISASSGAASLQQYTNIHYLRLFAQTDPGLFFLAAIGGILLVAWDWRTGLILDSWAAGFVLVLLRYHPLMGHHPVILLAPAAVLAGVGASFAFASRDEMRESADQRMGARSPETGWRLPWHGHAPSLYSISHLDRSAQAPGAPDGQSQKPVTGAVSRGRILRWSAIAGLLVCLALLPRLVSAYPSLLVRPSSTDTVSAQTDQGLAAIGRTVQLHSTPGDFIAADNAWVCVYADRQCVPDLVDTSDVRVKSGKLTSQQAIQATAAAHAPVVVLARAFCQFLPGYQAWVRTHYHLLQRLPGDPGQHCAIYVK